MEASVWSPDKVESLEVPPNVKSSSVQLSGNFEGKFVSIRGQDLKPVDRVFHTRSDSKCQHLIQRSYYGDKWAEMKVKTITYLKVNWG